MLKSTEDTRHEWRLLKISRYLHMKERAEVSTCDIEIHKIFSFY